MRSLRLKFFLISWPIVVAAIAIVALSVERFSKVELEMVATDAAPGPGRARVAAWADAVAEAWPPNDALLARLAASADPPPDLVVISADRVRMATTDPAISEAPGDREPGGAVHLQRVTHRGGAVLAEADFVMTGAPVRGPAGREVGRLFVVPRQPEPPGPGSAPWRARLRRTLWISAVVASLAAAAAALLLAGPLVRRVRRLSEASAAIGGGSLDARVEAGGSDELSRLGRSFNAMAETLQRAESHKRNLVTDVAHELRTPLTNVIGIVEAIQDGLRPANAVTLASLREEAGLLAALVDELQELSLAESGQLDFEMAAVDAVASSNAAIEAIRPHSGGVILSGPAGADPVLVRADARRLSQVLRNLLRNAITHTPRGGHVTVSVVAAGSRVTIGVADTGLGIPPEHLPLIWERFHRVDPSRDRASGGMGIGLAIVRQLVRGMEGDVGVESEPGRGSRFRVSLPRAS